MPNNFIPEEAVGNIHDQRSFLNFLHSNLNWKIEEDLHYDDLTYGWNPEDIGLRADDLQGSRISQLRPFVNEQPWGIFFLHIPSPKLYITELRKLLRAFAPMKRKHKDYPTWNPAHLLFICTPDWKNYTFAHFEGEIPEKAKLSTFGWEYESSFVRTLCEFNIPKLRFPEDEDMFGLDPKAWIEQWSSAFDVKPVTKKFYEEYDAVFKSMKRHLSKQFGFSRKLWEKEYDSWTEKERNADERLHLFIQNLVNRLMFLKFLEKRRWLDFNPNYLSDLYQKALSRGEDFYRKFLFYVFFAGLNRQVELLVHKEGTVTTKAQLFQQEIGVLPFLNGGLFEKEPIDEEIEIPNEAFKDLFDLFNRYNFTITEDTPLDVEVAVNPEMLGKVFEESVIARKEKGAYYTPRNIVSFMCREALKNYLKTNCSMRDEEAKINKLVDEHSAELLEDPDSLEIYKALYNVRVLDPAVGSGAFVVGMMLEILEVYKTIGKKLEKDHPYIVQNKLAQPSEVYNLKKQIIQNNLYGVDIEEFAVNIARLRFWLSLAVDFPIDFKDRDDFIANVHRIEPLPNLLYKVKRGDSLLAEYHGVSLEPHGRFETGEFKIGRKNRIQSSVADVTKLKKEFFAERDSTKKKNIQIKIESTLRGLVVREIEIEIDTLGKSLSQHAMFGLTKKERAEREAIEQQIRRLRAVKDELVNMDGLPIDFPLIWDVDFGEVMTDGGFDIVIANPPYVRQEDIKEYKPKLQKAGYKVYNSTSDLYTYFYEVAYNILAQGGFSCFITSNKWMRAKYGEKLRNFFKAKTKVLNLIDFGGHKVFEATVDTNIILFQKTQPSQEYKLPFVNIETDFSGEGLDEYLNIKQQSIKQSDLNDSGWTLADDKVLTLKKKIEKIGTPLKNWDVKINRGIITGFNEAFIINNDTKEKVCKEDPKSSEILKPILRGRDIDRYYYKWAGLWLIKIESGWTNKNRGKQNPESFIKETYPVIYKHLKANGKTQGKGKGLYNRDDQGDYWWELRDCDYYDEFEKEKIIYKDISEKLAFIYEGGKHFVNNTVYFINNGNKYLLAILNAKLIDFYYKQISSQLGNAAVRAFTIFIEQLPVPQISIDEQKPFIELVDRILAITKDEDYLQSPQKQSRIKSLEREIDEMVYKLYELTEEEIKIVEQKLQ